LHYGKSAVSINRTMMDIQHDSAVPIAEQITVQIMAHVASGALQAGARLKEYRAFAQELLANPQVVARAYADLEYDGVLKKGPGGVMEVTAGAAVICRVRLQDRARRRLRDAAAEALTWGLAEAEIHKAVDEAVASAQAPLSAAELQTAIKKASHETSHRASQGIQDLSRQKSTGSAQPKRPGGSDIRPARR
jgi:GntR family transcriptional regulator